MIQSARGCGDQDGLCSEVGEVGNRTKTWINEITRGKYPIMKGKSRKGNEEIEKMERKEKKKGGGK